jgi:hypothetical protein
MVLHNCREVEKAPMINMTWLVRMQDWSDPNTDSAIGNVEEVNV